MEDVKVTLDDKDLEKLESNELTEDLNEKCSICMMEMKKGEKYTKLPCNHGFHTDCVMQWFKEYNYKCPVCRKEYGKPLLDRHMTEALANGLQFGLGGLSV